ncbi:MAG: ABC transporter permease [Pseudomonadota bacterium]|nr:ABC transporter permease [Pseudomonadota bacterium]
MSIDPDSLHVALGAIFLVLNAGLSILLGLGIVRRMAIAAARMVVQLALVGLVLDVVLTTRSPALIVLTVSVMTAVAAYEVIARQERPLAGIWGYGLGGATMLFGAAVVTVFALGVQLRPDPWYDPRFAVPLFGMILGNAMTGIALVMNAFVADVTTRRRAIEAHLLAGAPRMLALRASLRRAATAGLVPIVNAMAATGVVSLPGMMTGQILAGADPAQAVRYQIMVMFLIAGATGLGVSVAAWGMALRLSDSRHRLRVDRLRG